MKKLLSILAAVGLTATASTAVVACGSSKNASIDAKVDMDKKTATFTKNITIYKGTHLEKSEDKKTYDVEPGTDFEKKGETNHTYILLEMKASDINDKTMTDKGTEGKVLVPEITTDVSNIKDGDIDKDGSTTKDIENVKVTFTIDIADAITAAKGKAVKEDWTLTDVKSVNGKSDKDATYSVESKTTINVNIPATKTTPVNPGDKTPSIDANQTLNITDANGSVTINGANLQDIKSASDIKLTGKKAGAIDAKTIASLVKSVEPAKDGSSVKIAFQNLDKQFDDTYTVQLGSIKTTATLNINIDGGKQPVNPGTNDNSKVNISAATISEDGKTITLTTDALVVAATPTDFTITGAEIDKVDGAVGTTSVTITLKAAVAKDAAVTIKGYATTKAITIDTSKITAAPAAFSAVTISNYAD